MLGSHPGAWMGPERLEGDCHGSNQGRVEGAGLPAPKPAAPRAPGMWGIHQCLCGGWRPFPSVPANASPWHWPAPVRPVAVCGALGTQLRASYTHRTDPTERAIGRTAGGTVCWRVNPRLPCGRITGQPHLTSQGLADSCPLRRRKDDAGGPRVAVLEWKIGDLVRHHPWGQRGGFCWS